MGVLPDFLIETQVKIEPFDDGASKPGRISSGLTSYGYDARLGYKFRVMTPHRCTAAIIDPKQDDPTAWTEIDLTPRPSAKCEWCEGAGVIRGSMGPFPCAKCYGAGVTAPLNPPSDFLPIPPGGFVLGETLETFTVPRDVLCLVTGKSTYARVGIQIYVTPGEPEWTGRWTVEINNTAPLPVKVYPGEGIMQCVFLRSDAQTQGMIRALQTFAPGFDEGLVNDMDKAALASCRRSYADKKGKYQSQGGLTPAKVV